MIDTRSIETIHVDSWKALSVGCSAYVVVVEASAEHDGNDRLAENGEELLGDVLVAHRVLERQVELVLVADDLLAVGRPAVAQVSGTLASALAEHVDWHMLGQLVDVVEATTPVVAVAYDERGEVGLGRQLALDRLEVEVVVELPVEIGAGRVEVRKVRLERVGGRQIEAAVVYAVVVRVHRRLVEHEDPALVGESLARRRWQRVDVVAHVHEYEVALGNARSVRERLAVGRWTVVVDKWLRDAQAVAERGAVAKRVPKEDLLHAARIGVQTLEVDRAILIERHVARIHDAVELDVVLAICVAFNVSDRLARAIHQRVSGV